MSDVDLVRSYLSGDDKAFTIIHDKYSYAVKYTVSRRLRDRLSIYEEDVIQDVWIKISGILALWNPDNGKLITWLTRVAYNHCIDFMRTQMRPNIVSTYKMLDIDFGRFDFADSEYDDSWEDKIMILEAILECLDHKGRDIFVKKIYHGLKFREIADETGLGIENIKSKYYRFCKEVEAIYNKKKTPKLTVS